MIVRINGKDTWRPNFVRTRKSETCRSFFTVYIDAACRTAFRALSR